MPDAAAIEQIIKEVVCRKLFVKPEQVILTASFVIDLGADSLDQVEMVMEFEDRFSIVIPGKEAEKIQTVGDAIKYIEKHCQGQSPGKEKR